MSSGAYGLLGVLVGALISGGFEWWFQRRKRRGRVRQSARLVRQDFLNAVAWRDNTIRTGKRPVSAFEAMPIQTSGEYLGTLAAELRERDAGGRYRSG